MMDIQQIEKKVADYFSSREAVIAVYLFGSVVGENSITGHDIDIAVLFDYVAIPDGLQRIEIQEDLAEILAAEVDLILLNRISPVLKMQIFQKGVLVWEGEPTARRRYWMYALSEYYDFKRIRRPSERSLLRGRIRNG